jgi:DMSO/TMAO reductase YedYZ molybdopterin-dependent catalytic subunit
MPRLPAGQTTAPLRRFGLPVFAAVRPNMPARPAVTVTGAVRHPTQLEVFDLLSAGARVDRVADLHCVTAWTATGLRWSGVRFADVHQRLASLVDLHPAVAWVTFGGLDGYRSCLRLDDALQALLVDRLDGAPLPADHGAPLRLVAPAHYGYKSVKHLYAIEYRRAYDPGSAGWLAHRRGRVAHEERSPLLPGWVWRRAQQAVRRRYAAQQPSAPHQPEEPTQSGHPSTRPDRGRSGTTLWPLDRVECGGARSLPSGRACLPDDHCETSGASWGRLSRR